MEVLFVVELVVVETDDVVFQIFFGVVVVWVVGCDEWEEVVVSVDKVEMGEDVVHVVVPFWK